MPELVSTSLFNDANLVSYYKLEDTSDSKGSNTLTNNNTVTFTAAQFNNGANLGTSNTNKYLSTANRISIDGGACSFVFWVKLLSEVGTAGTYIMFEQRSNQTSKSRYLLNYFESGGNRSLRLDRVRTGTAVDSTSTYNVTLGTSDFYHIACTYDGTNLLVYVNAVQQASGTSTGNGSTTSGTEGFAIGADTGGSLPASALIDDFGVFTRALSSSDVATLFATTGPNADTSYAYFM